jgi:hypothetical protein
VVCSALLDCSSQILCFSLGLSTNVIAGPVDARLPSVCISDQEDFGLSQIQGG